MHVSVRVRVSECVREGYVCECVRVCVRGVCVCVCVCVCERELGHTGDVTQQRREAETWLQRSVDT